MLSMIADAVHVIGDSGDDELIEVSESELRRIMCVPRSEMEKVVSQLHSAKGRVDVQAAVEAAHDAVQRAPDDIRPDASAFATAVARSHRARASVTFGSVGCIIDSMELDDAGAAKKAARARGDPAPVFMMLYFQARNARWSKDKLVRADTVLDIFLAQPKVGRGGRTVCDMCEAGLPSTNQPLAYLAVFRLPRGVTVNEGVRLVKGLNEVAAARMQAGLLGGGHMLSVFSANTGSEDEPVLDIGYASRQGREIDVAALSVGLRKLGMVECDEHGKFRATIGEPIIALFGWCSVHFPGFIRLARRYLRSVGWQWGWDFETVAPALAATLPRLQVLANVLNNQLYHRLKDERARGGDRRSIWSLLARHIAEVDTGTAGDAAARLRALGFRQSCALEPLKRMLRLFDDGQQETPGVSVRWAAARFVEQTLCGDLVTVFIDSDVDSDGKIELGDRRVPLVRAQWSRILNRTRCPDKLGPHDVNVPMLRAVPPFSEEPAKGYTRWFHGTIETYASSISKRIRVDSRLGSPHCDFGLGFYLAGSAFYAAWIASSFASESSCARPIVMVFDLPDAYVKQARVLMNDEWAQAVCYFRRGKHPLADGLKDELDDVGLLQGSIVLNSEGVDCGKKPMPVNDVQQLAVKAHIARDFYQHARLAAVVLFDEPI